MANRTPAVDRVLAKCAESGEPFNGSPCWVYTAYINKDGYGQAKYGSRAEGNEVMRHTHRITYEALIAEIPKGLELDHLCRNRACCNPWHLEPVSHAVNVRRGDGGKCHAAKTHCPSGHAYDDENTYVNPTTKRRSCRTCQRAASRQWQAERRRRMSKNSTDNTLEF